MTQNKCNITNIGTILKKTFWWILVVLFSYLLIDNIATLFQLDYSKIEMDWSNDTSNPSNDTLLLYKLILLLPVEIPFYYFLVFHKRNALPKAYYIVLAIAFISVILTSLL